MATPTHIGHRDPGDGSYQPGLQTQAEPVVRDNLLYDAFIASLDATHTLGSGMEQYQQDLFSRSPLSGVVGFWNTRTQITVTVSSTDVPAAPAIVHTYTDLEVDQVITLPVLGFVARAAVPTVCQLSVSDGVNTFQTSVTLAALPPTDTEAGISHGFPEIRVTQVAEEADVGDELYFTAVSPARAFIAFDRQANVRWYVLAGDPDNAPSLCLPTYNTVRLADGTFIGSDDHLRHYYIPSDLGANEPLGQRELWRFDATGRVHGVYFVRDRAHHSLHELAGENALLYTSDFISARNSGEGPDPDGANQGPTSEDCIAILDLTTGFERAYYDLRFIMNFWRTPVPLDFSIPNTYDWVHLNQVVFDSNTGLLIASCRHQGAVIGVDRESGELRFISANHDEWEATESGEPTTDWSDLLLAPVNPDTGLAYDLSQPLQKAQADRSFWTWGQHNVQVTRSASGSSLLEFSIFNNGNYRTRDRELGVVASENASRCARYQVDLNSREVRKLSEYGESEIGAEGYSPYVSTARFFDFQGDATAPRLLANFGGSNFQQNVDYPAGLPVTLEPGYSDRIDPAEDLSAPFQGRVILQEIDLNTAMPLFEIQLTSGVFKTPAGDETDIRRIDLYAFRAYKMALYS
ncbi:aryl-sulfate sulfotransferase [Buttiauxella selenatireducens]|uniref:Aryl-sulfate sulfotransferase n=1 Tax=Buttiauxella selenatireducens TaxID=3073902 RepID=A0ABY9S5C0_9ENTR|nr:aryl-sulfate sulfotransferase [Buttiauxella sp. R73]WMY72534.1 aryl-sulfate sulfotransferase [Buttiauxella sp. R73]